MWYWIAEPCFDIDTPLVQPWRSNRANFQNFQDFSPSDAIQFCPGTWMWKLPTFGILLNNYCNWKSLLTSYSISNAATLILKLIFLHLSSSKSEHLRLKLECEKLAQEKTEMQRHYVMVSFLINLSRSRFQIKRGQLNIRDLNPYVQLYFWCVGLDLTLVMKICRFINS